MHRARGIAVTTALAAVLLAACSSSSPASSSSTTKPPEALRTTPARVAQGLAELKALMVTVKAASNDPKQLDGITTRIERIWQPIEGTIRANSPNTYLAFEDAFSAAETAAKNNAAAKLRQATDTITSTADGYLAKYPS